MFVDKNLVKFLQFREKILDTSGLEQKYGIRLPPIYRSFISVFEPEFAFIKLKSSNTDDFGTFVQPIFSREKKQTYTINDDDLCLQGFLELEDVLKFERKYLEWEGDLIYIGDHAYNGGLMVGIQEHNLDEIYHKADAMKPEYMAKNIFELIQKMVLVEVDFDFPALDTKKLYRNWNEDFWRVKGDNLL